MDISFSWGALHELSGLNLFDENIRADDIMNELKKYPNRANEKKSDGLTPLLVACNNSNWEAVGALLMCLEVNIEARDEVGIYSR